MGGNFKITVGGMKIEEIGANGSMREVHNMPGASWVGDYETVITIQREVRGMINSFFELGETQLAAMKAANDG